MEGLTERKKKSILIIIIIPYDQSSGAVTLISFLTSYMQTN